MDKKDIKIAYFSAEFGIDGLAYNGGLGILAGDFLKSCADLNAPVVGVGMHYSKGNFHQKLSQDGWQTEEYPDTGLELETNNARVGVPLREGNVIVQSKNYKVHSTVPGEENNFVPLVLAYDKGNQICDGLYPGGSQKEKRLKQEAILGIGGVEMLNALGYDNIRVYHLNEGHAALATVVADGDIIFTTHTPMPAGIDEYDKKLAEGILLDSILKKAYKISEQDGSLHMMKLAMGDARYSFGVSRLHQQVSKILFGDFPSMKELSYVDNGVHLPTWSSPEVQKLYDRLTEGKWRKEPKLLEAQLINLDLDEVVAVHSSSRERLGKFLSEDRRVRGNARYDPEKLTLGFARRFATYKQADLLFDNVDRLRKLGKDIQIVYAGKSHPDDNGGKELIKRVFYFMNKLKGEVPIWFIEDYDIEIGKYMVQGVDLWLNNPLRLQEAAGTSGMKAAANFVPQLSIVEGWWNPQGASEGYNLPKGLVEGVTGWGIGRIPSIDDLFLLQENYITKAKREEDRRNDSKDALDKLEGEIVPRFKDKKKKSWAAVMRGAAAHNVPWFNSCRMAEQYFEKYGLKQI